MVAKSVQDRSRAYNERMGWWNCQVYAVVEDEVELTISAALQLSLRRRELLMTITETNLM